MSIKNNNYVFYLFIFCYSNNVIVRFSKGIINNYVCKGDN